jgi:quinol monooxygenase YgiN
MIKVGLFVRLEAKPGKEEQIERLLKESLSAAEEEIGTTAWFAFRLGPTTFGIFDVFPDESWRQAHLSGRIAATLMSKAPELFATPLTIENLDVLAVKLPQLETSTR